jgi:hypothetical protein
MANPNITAIGEVKNMEVQPAKSYSYLYLPKNWAGHIVRLEVISRSGNISPTKARGNPGRAKARNPSRASSFKVEL